MLTAAVAISSTTESVSGVQVEDGRFIEEEDIVQVVDRSAQRRVHLRVTKIETTNDTDGATTFSANVERLPGDFTGVHTYPEGSRIKTAGEPGEQGDRGDRGDRGEQGERGKGAVTVLTAALVIGSTAESVSGVQVEDGRFIDEDEIVRVVDRSSQRRVHLRVTTIETTNDTDGATTFSADVERLPGDFTGDHSYPAGSRIKTAGERGGQGDRGDRQTS